MGPSHTALMRFKAQKCATLDEVRAWFADEYQRQKACKLLLDKHRITRMAKKMKKLV